MLQRRKFSKQLTDRAAEIILDDSSKWLTKRKIQRNKTQDGNKDVEIRHKSKKIKRNFGKIITVRTFTRIINETI